MNHWKLLGVGVLLFPAMAMAQQTEPEGAADQQQQEMPGEMAPRDNDMMRDQERPEREYLTRLEQNQVLVDKLIGSPVRARGGEAMRQDQDAAGQQQEGQGIAAEGEEIGTVDDLILGGDGEVVGIVVGVGGWLGIGERDVALSWEMIDVQRDPEDPDAFIVLVDVDPEAVENAPEFERDNNDGIF